MAFISVAEELTKRSQTNVDNKFINKYLPELDPVAVKLYLYALYLCQNGQSAYTLSDVAQKFNLTEEQVMESFEHLDEFELVSITSRIPFEIKILDCENFYGKPKKLHPEKYDGLYQEIQDILTERMIDQNEFREYLFLLEEYKLERNAFVMIVNYCVNFKDDKSLKWQYIRKVTKNFCEDGDTTCELVEKRLQTYTACTPVMYRICSACSIKKNPEVRDSETVAKWLNLGFSEEAVICAAKGFKIKSFEKLDALIDELYRNSKFDAKEIEDYRKAKNSLYETTIEVAKSLGIFVSDPTPYVENYVSVWCGYGFDVKTIKKIANYCFLSGKNSFESMNEFVSTLYKDAYVDEASVTELLNKFAEDDKFIKSIHDACGLTRKIIPYDRQALSRWRDWGFNEAMILKAAELSAGKNNPMAAINYLLASWKNNGIYTVEQIPAQGKTTKRSTTNRSVTDEWAETLAKLRNLNNDGE
ncbi:MAG: DnaD domain protein [Clostridia bacterium]|nr:DnaD domain protein [Clostridia bacterium]